MKYRNMSEFANTLIQQQVFQSYIHKNAYIQRKDPNSSKKHIMLIWSENIPNQESSVSEKIQK